MTSSPARVRRKALLLVFDGLGFSRARAREVVNEVWDRLPAAARSEIERAAVTAISGRTPSSTDRDLLARQYLYPVRAEAIDEGAPFEAALSTLGALSSAPIPEDVRRQARDLVQRIALEHRYVPWAAQMPVLNDLRNRGVSVPTSASGIWAGFEDLDPPVQGNSDTGHQQIGNLTMAPQTPLEITLSIEDGSFFRNDALTGVLEQSRSRETELNFSFMLSGTRGDDGRVHGAWNHLEAFLELVFKRLEFPPARVRMQGILDGRDCPRDSSINRHRGAGDYLGKLQELLRAYDAEDCLAWVIGRNIAMDRDYREPDARADYLLLTRGEGEQVSGFEGVRSAIAEVHRNGKADGDVPPLAVVGSDGEPYRIRRGDAFVDLHFRADRQRARTGALIGARDYLKKSARAHGKEWSLDWLDDSLDLSVCTLAEYDPQFEKYGVRVAYPNRAHRENLLALFSDLLPGDRYFLVGESVKSAHVGYFIRGRREAPAASGIEDRKILPSCGEAEGVKSDSDFYKTPAMRNIEVAEAVHSGMESGRYRLICANFSNCDMVGHLLPDRFEAAVEACEALDQALGIVAPAARLAGYDLVLTSDHGNIEEDSTAHTTNDVLTTVLLQGAKTLPARREEFQARLFDIPWTLGRLLGIEDAIRERMGRWGAYDERFVGRPLIEPAQ
ncbi:MAG: alkaline phosphatase family protein [Chloroflexi bacterium]|nr:alkaline phosphatase family protein [Chloroflexota bacterium]